MPLELFPQSVQLLPSDRQLFTARAKDLTPMWTCVNGVVRPNASVDQSIASGGANQSVSALDSAQQLVGGIGSFEFELDSQSLAIDPVVGVDGFFSWTAFFGSPSAPDTWQYRIKINPTNVEIRDEANTLLVTLQHNNAAGDKFRVELNSGFRLFINNTLLHERVSGFTGGIKYPAFYGDVTLQRASATGAFPRIPAPKLAGDWQLRPKDRLNNPVVVFTAPSHGSIGAGASDLEKEYFNGTIPGPYELAARIDVGIEIWVEDGIPSGGTLGGGTTGSWVNSPPPVPFSGNLELRIPNASGHHFYFFTGATRTLQVLPGDVLTCIVYLDAATPPSEIMLKWGATDATGFEHRAYWGANSISGGTDGTPSRRFMGSLPATGQWVKLEVPASLVDMEGRVANGMSFELFDGRCEFDQAGKYPGNLQHAEALIAIPPLQIAGELVRTLPPGAKARFHTNYNEAQITWSVVSGGGSFSQGEFTAPTAPGTTIVRATASVGNQVADLTINVPAILTPNFFAAAPSELVDWETNIVSPTWSSIPAGINSSTGVWTAPSVVGQTVKITATGGGFTVTRDVLILEKFPFGNFVFPYTVDYRKGVLISEAEDGTRVARVKRPSHRAYDVQLGQCEEADFQTVRDFWDRHHPSKRVIFEDLEEGIRIIAHTDSDLQWERTAAGVNIAFRVKEAAQAR